MDNRYITVLDFEVGRIFQYKTDTLDVPIGDTIHECNFNNVKNIIDCLHSNKDLNYKEKR